MSNPITYRFSLDLQKNTSNVFCRVMLGDTNSRLVISFNENSEPYEIGSGTTAMLLGAKGDGTILYDSCTVDTDQNAVIYQFTEQTANAAGFVACQIRLAHNGVVKSSPLFRLDVQEGAVPKGDGGGICDTREIRSEWENGYDGLRAAQTAETYIEARQIDGVRFNYKVNGIFDYHEANDSNDNTDEEESGSPDNIVDDDISGGYTSSDAIESDSQFDDYDPEATSGYRLFTYASQPKTKHKYDYKGTFTNQSDLTGHEVGWYKRTTDNTYWYWDGTSLYNTDYLNTIAPAVDCSTFVSLVLRGIPYSNSPWIVYGDGHNTWDPSNIVNLYGDEGWEQRDIDLQPEGKYRDLGISGYSSLRYAADFAEYYFKNGLVIYDRNIHNPAERNDPNTIPTVEDVLKAIQPGDLIFWSNVAAVDSPSGNPHNKGYYEAVIVSDHTEYVLSSDMTVDVSKTYYTMKQINRFRCVSHIAMVAANTAYTVEVTSGNSMPSAVYYRRLRSSRLTGITMIIRPDYRPSRMKGFKTRAVSVPIPKNVNLCTYPWVFSQKKITTNENLTRTSNGGNSISLSMSSANENNLTIGLKGSTSKGTDADFENCLTLPAGTYRLSGMSPTGVQSSACALQITLWDDVSGWVEYNSTLRYSSDGENWNTQDNEKIRCFSGSHSIVEFTLSEKTHIRVALYVSTSVSSLDCTVTPTLIRV